MYISPTPIFIKKRVPGLSLWTAWLLLLLCRVEYYAQSGYSGTAESINGLVLVGTQDEHLRSDLSHVTHAVDLIRSPSRQNKLLDPREKKKKKKSRERYPFFSFFDAARGLKIKKI